MVIVGTVRVVAEALKHNVDNTVVDELANRFATIDSDFDSHTFMSATVPLLDELERWVDVEKPKVVPTSPLGRALGYAAQQRPFVRRCFEDGRFEIDNGHTERQIREPAIGRKNYLFTGSARAAKRL